MLVWERNFGGVAERLGEVFQRILRDAVVILVLCLEAWGWRGEESRRRKSGRGWTF